jgi:hypothetical protein
MGVDMTSISSATSQQFSPLSRLQSELASEVSAGTISRDDKSALSSALTDIDSAMKSGAASSRGAPPSPDAMKAKVDGLIDGEVKDGKLTSAQAAELKSVFAQAFSGGPGGAGGPGGPGGAGGPGGPRGAGGGGGAGKTSKDPADTNGDGTVSAAEQAAYDAKNPAQADATSDSSNSDPSKLLSDFLKLLQDSKSGSSSYSTDGNGLKAQIESLIVNYQA